MSYYANGMMASQTQNGATLAWTLDPQGNRENTWTDSSTGRTFTNHYSCGCDSPSWTADSAGGRTRNVDGIGGMLAAAVSLAGVTRQLVNPHGDIMATETPGTGDIGPTATFTYREFGGVESGTPNGYGWLGGYQRSSIALGGQLLMGVRDYNPDTGRFAQVDPVYGGNTNAYDYPENPMTAFDTSGMWKMSWGWFSATLYFNKHETKTVSRASAVIGLINTALTILIESPGILLKWVAMNAAAIALVASWANSDHECLKLKWPYGYPGLLPYEYRGGYCT